MSKYRICKNKYGWYKVQMWGRGRRIEKWLDVFKNPNFQFGDIYETEPYINPLNCRLVLAENREKAIEIIKRFKRQKEEQRKLGERWDTEWIVDKEIEEGIKCQKN